MKKALFNRYAYGEVYIRKEMGTLKNVLEYLENSAKIYSDKIAIIDEYNQISYKELLCRSQKIGSYLCDKTKMRKPIAIFMDKSIEALAIFMGVVYAGCFYTLIDPSFPEKRIRKLIDILDTDIVITNNCYIEKLSKIVTEEKIIKIEDINSNIDINKLDCVRENMRKDDPLYCNFTSGSTGVPKGVLINHNAVIEFIDNFVDIFSISNKDVIGNQAPFDFDVSVKDIYSCFKSGATMVIIPKKYFMEPVKLMDMLQEFKVTTLIWAVSALVMLTRLHGLKYKVPEYINKVMFSGEAMPMKHLNKWIELYKDATFVNLYGPTEITCNCTYHILEREYNDEEKLPIGKPFPNDDVYLIKKNKIIEKNCANEIGEICVSGPSVAMGYFNNDEVSKKYFIDNPFSHNNHDKVMYKTGDLGYWGVDGLLYFAGRKDFQIKHMGHRIELEEIERALISCTIIEQACCFFDTIKNKIVAYCVGSTDKKAIINEMKEKVPEYMIPNIYRCVDMLPLNKNGKTDRNRLKQMYMEGK